jgi:multimeric flavodoxin WrbA
MQKALFLHNIMDNSSVIILASNRIKRNTKKFVTDTYGAIISTVVDVLDYTTSPSSYKGIYPYNNNFKYIITRALQNDEVVLATPVYWYRMSGLMKKSFERLTDLVTVDKETGRKFKSKIMKVLTTKTDEILPVDLDVRSKIQRTTLI